ncbi:hypothetical protein N9L68_06995 [bacterium]|nr:hypothetical protein [bacterium]
MKGWARASAASFTSHVIMEMVVLEALLRDTQSVMLILATISSVAIDYQAPGDALDEHRKQR